MKYILYILFALTAYVPFILPYGALDAVYPELLYLSIAQLIITTTLLFYKKKHNLDEIIKSPIIILLILFLGWSFLTIIFSFNKIESIIEWFRFFVFFLSIVNLTILYNFIRSKGFFFFIIISLLSIETYYVFREFLIFYDFENPPGRLYNYVGLTSNLNVTAFSILIKLVLSYYTFINSKNKLIRFLLISLISISTFVLIIIASRSSIILLIGVQIILLVFSGIAFKYKKIQIIDFKNIIVIILITVATFFTQSFLYQNSQDFSIENRITSFDFENPTSSTNFRLSFYKEAIKGFTDNPFFGVGLGNWKIFSIFYASERIREYQVPYHAHNDFLQVFAETGIIGGILYTLIFLTPIFFILKSLIDGSNRESFFLSLILGLSILVFTGDSMFNFPKARAISMMNLIYIISFYIIEKEYFKIQFFNKKLFKLTYIVFLPISFISVFVFIKLYDNSKKQVILMQDYNYTRYFDRDLNYIETISDEFPNLSHTAMPMSNIKANYFAYQGKNDKAKELFRKGNLSNPFLGDSDIGLARLYYNEKIYDSAYIFSKKAIEKLPYNAYHIALHQDILLKLNKNKYLKEARDLFNKVKHDKVNLIWENHLLIELNYTSLDSIKDYHKDLAKEALEIFPDSKKILLAEKLFTNDKNSILLANEYDSSAFKQFEDKNYLKAIENWEKSKILVSNEDSYYLNIAQSYIQIKNYDAALEELKLLEKLSLQENDGKLEFLKASALYEKKQFRESCKFYKISSQKGYSLSKDVLKKIKCP